MGSVFRGIVFSLAVSLCFTSTAAAFDSVDFFVNYEPEGRDLTQELFEPSEKSLEELKPQLQDLNFVLVAGFFSDFASTVERTRFDRALNLKPQFFDQINVLKELELPYSLLDIESEAGPELNAELIKDKLLSLPDHSVALITHSKGCIDALEAFLLYPELRKKIRFWIPLQGPFMGSPAADLALSHPSWLKSMDRILKWMGGSIDSLISISVEFRITHMLALEDELQQILEEVPILSVATSKPDEKGKWDTRFEPFFRDWLLKKGVENDGIVPWKSAIYPSSHFVHIEGLDHLWIESKELKQENPAHDLMKKLYLMAYELSE